MDLVKNGLGKHPIFDSACARHKTQKNLVFSHFDEMHLVQNVLGK